MRRYVFFVFRSQCDASAPAEFIEQLRDGLPKPPMPAQRRRDTIRHVYICASVSTYRRRVQLASPPRMTRLVPIAPENPTRVQLIPSPRIPEDTENVSNSPRPQGYKTRVQLKSSPRIQNTCPTCIVPEDRNTPHRT